MEMSNHPAVLRKEIEALGNAIEAAQHDRSEVIAGLQADNERLRAALWMVREDLAHLVQQIDAAHEQSAPKLEPHAYMPSAQHMGDCYLCGHEQGAPIHSLFRRS